MESRYSFCYKGITFIWMHNPQITFSDNLLARHDFEMKVTCVPVIITGQFNRVSW